MKLLSGFTSLLAGLLLSFPLHAVDVEKNAGERRNVIFLIGDGMGLAHVGAAMTANRQPLNLERSTAIGLSKTAAANKYVTDSAAGGTALACGIKTDNGFIGLTPDRRIVRSMLEYAQDDGKATGVVVTCAVTHATPAAFVAHQPSRKMQEEIALDFLDSKIDLFIGGGRKFFEARGDGRNLSDTLRNNGFKIAYTLDEVTAAKSGKLAAFLAEDGLPTVSEGRGDMLRKSVDTALTILNQNPKGFVLMIEGSQIDWAAHRNEIDYVTSETIDFDDALKVAMDFADKDGNTLVVVAADHETGGLSLLGGDAAEGTVKPGWSTKGHSASMVPVYAYGAGAERFSGIYENTGVFDRIMDYLGYTPTAPVLVYDAKNPKAGN